MCLCGGQDPSCAAEGVDESGQRRSNWISEIEVDVKRTYVIDRGYDLWKNKSPVAGGMDNSQSAGVEGEGSLDTEGSSFFCKQGSEAMDASLSLSIGRIGDDRQSSADDDERVLRQDSEGRFLFNLPACTREAVLRAGHTATYMT